MRLIPYGGRAFLEYYQQQGTEIAEHVVALRHCGQGLWEGSVELGWRRAGMSVNKELAKHAVAQQGSDSRAEGGSTAV